MFRLIFVLAFFAPTLVWSQDTLEIRINPEKALAPMVTYERLGAGELRVAVTVSGVPVGDLGLKDLEVRSELSQYELRSVEPMLHTENAKVSIILCIDNSQS
ncbi:MAG: hypothetical protein ACE5IY_23745, partial [bacterium]